jgi:hypothetical protein
MYIDTKYPKRKAETGDFYESTRQVVYSKRGTSIEPLIEHIKPSLG